MPKFSKGHYQVIAQEIMNVVTLAHQEHGETGWPKLDASKDIADRLAYVFTQDNPNFNKNLFLKACGFPFDWSKS